MKVPFFLSLEAERDTYFQNFERTRDSARQERIKVLQRERESRVVVYYSVNVLTARHAELLQDLLDMRPPVENLDVFLLSPGGYADAAHKIVSICRAHSTRRLGILIPYYAKSAATLLCLGADELVMGPASEIGPTDPRIPVPDQYGRIINISAVSIRDALELLEGRTKDRPELALLYTPLLERLDLNVIGEYERALKSSEQIAKTLLETYMLRADPSKAAEVASLLSRGYYSHGHTIDRSEARSRLGLSVTDATSNQWDAMWQLHKLYDALIRDSIQPDGRQVQAVFESEDMRYLEYSEPRTGGAAAQQGPA